MDLFAMKEGESRQDIFTRLNDLALALKGYDLDLAKDDFIVEKFLRAIMPTHSSMVFHVQ